MTFKGGAAGGRGGGSGIRVAWTVNGKSEQTTVMAGQSETKMITATGTSSPGSVKFTSFDVSTGQQMMIENMMEYEMVYSAVMPTTATVVQLGETKKWYLSFLFKGETKDDTYVKWKLDGKDDQIDVPANTDVPKDFEFPSETQPEEFILMVYKADKSGQTFFTLADNSRSYVPRFNWTEVKPSTPTVLTTGSK